MPEAENKQNSILGMLPAIGGAVAGVGQMLGIGEKRQDKRQLRQQEALSKQQAEIQGKMQMDMWNNTNYGAQVQHLKDAGLNPALLYGKGGGGGATVGGGVSGGQASNSASAMQANTGQMQGMAMLPAQIELIRAQTENVKADTATKGVQPENIVQNTAESKSRQKGIDLENEWRKFIQTPDEASNGQSLREREMRVTTNKVISEMTKIDEQLKLIGVDIKKGQSEIERVKANTALQQQAYKQLEKINPIELQNLQKDLEIKLNNPANTEEAQWIQMIINMIGGVLGMGVQGSMIKQMSKPKTAGGINIHNWGNQ